MKIIEPSQTPLTEDRYDSQFVLTLDSKGSGADVPKNLVVAMQPADFHRIKDRQKNILLYAWSPSAQLRQVIEESRLALLPTCSLTLPGEEIGQAAARTADPLARWMLEELVDVLPQLHDSVTTLSQTVGPLGDLANRIPGGRRKVTNGS